jgi:hypothetical protein
MSDEPSAEIVAMRRQFSNLKIEALEALFDERRTNPDVLASILGELSHRRTSRARKLRERVVRALSVGTSEAAKRLASHNPSPDPFHPPNDDAALLILTPEQHHRVAEIYRNGGPDWTDEELAYAAKLAEHHEMVAKGIERRSRGRKS